MDSDLIKALAYFIAANGQAVGTLWMAFKLNAYLEKEYPISYPWSYIVWPLAVASVIQLYYMVMKALIRLEKNKKK
jgi:hypothetical protein